MSTKLVRGIFEKYFHDQLTIDSGTKNDESVLNENLTECSQNQNCSENGIDSKEFKNCPASANSDERHR